MSASRSRAQDNARIRARRRAEGLTPIEAVLHQDEIAALDRVKRELGFTSRSEVLRALIARMDIATFSPENAATLLQRAV